MVTFGSADAELDSRLDGFKGHSCKDLHFNLLWTEECKREKEGGQSGVHARVRVRWCMQMFRLGSDDASPESGPFIECVDTHSGRADNESRSSVHQLCPRSCVCVCSTVQLESRI